MATPSQNPDFSAMYQVYVEACGKIDYEIFHKTHHASLTGSADPNFSEEIQKLQALREELDVIFKEESEHGTLNRLVSRLNAIISP